MICFPFCETGGKNWSVYPEVASFLHKPRMGEVTEASWLGKGLGPVEPFGGGEGAGLPSAIASGANMLSILHSAIFCHILSVNLVPRKKQNLNVPQPSNCPAAREAARAVSGRRDQSLGSWLVENFPCSFAHEWCLVTGIWGFSVPGDILENSEKPGHREGVFTLLATTRSTLELPTHDYVHIYIYILVEKISAMQFHTGTWTYIIIAILW